MRRIFRHICETVFLGALALGAVSCEEEPVVPDPELIMVKNTVSSKKGSQFLTVVTPGAWTLSSDADWVQIIPDKGRGSSHSIALCYDANKEESGRKADIVLQAEGKEIVLTLTQSAFTPDETPEFNGEPNTRKGWMELPETLEDDGLNFFWHTMNISGYTGRNYSFYWDYADLVSHWVAYPLNTALRGSGSRSDAWSLDPLLPASKQPNVTSTYRGGWARGHQLPSADRLHAAANAATFYGTNITPQNYNFNGEIWARLEESVRNWSYKCDTLYVVTGCVVNERSSRTTDIDGKSVAIPVAYYKAVLSYSKSLEANGGYRGCAVYLDHNHPAGETVRRNHPSVMSIRDLENKLGINLFVNLPGAVGESAAAAVETEDPNTVSWWW
ncbi:MAG: DNA/RNA non-specific endonuclease [Bacteroidales bacterium]|nr:DNA/RNA non-specific endonuclease [Bacteroidales bacterium]